MGLVYLGTGGGLLAYLAYSIVDWSSAPPFTYEPLEELLMHLTMLFGGVVIFVLLGLGLYYIIKSASHSQS
jgi:hypothetical protein